MKSYIKKILLTLFIFFIFVFSVKAFDFVKYSGNPLTVNYINGYSKLLQVHIFKKDNYYYGIATVRKDTDNFFSLVLIKSSDGITWQMEKEILRTGEELSSSRYIETLNGNKLFFTRYDSDGKYRIYLSNCDSNFNCSVNFQPLLDIDSGNTTEQNGMFGAFPYLQNNRAYIFYGVWGIDGFKIRLAYSDDWQNWVKCPNQATIMYGGDGPFVLEENGILNLFYHKSDSSGIKMAKTTFPLSCESQFEDQGYQLAKGQSYDYQHMFFPSVVDTDNNLLLYYTGRSQTGENRLNRASTPEPTPTETPVPTQTPTPTPTPTPSSSKTPVIIIPGFMASWNREAILFNMEVDQSEWKMPSFVKEYDGLIKTLENLGYVKNKDYFIFNYDWRKPILGIVEDFNKYLSSHPSTSLRTSQFSIVGHSLGGLVGRFYQERFQNDKLSKLITVGSSHKGVAQVYKIVEAGEIDRSNSYFWLAVKTVLNLNRNKLEKDKDVINRLFPVLKDLFPVYNFLKKDGVEIDFNSMYVKNTLLGNADDIELLSIIGEKGSTLKGFNVVDQTFSDKLLGIYPDGRPISEFYDSGDYLVLTSSAKIEPSITLNLDHGEIIYKKEAIKRILDLLNIQYEDAQIVEGKPTRLDRALVFLIRSKGKMEVESGSKRYKTQDGIIFIKNPAEKKYRIKVRGTRSENDEIFVFKIYQNKEKWEKIGRKNLPNQINNYEINN